MSYSYKPSPYKVLFEWLLRRDNNLEVPKEVLNARIPAKYILLNFVLHKDACLFINDFLNNVNIYQLDDILIFQTLKYICKKFRLTNRHIAFIKKGVIENIQLYRKIQSKLPELKINEIKFLHERYGETQEFIDVLESLGLNDNVTKEKQKKPKKKVIKFKDVIQEFLNIKDRDVLCKTCDLYNNKIALFDSNCKANITDTEILFVAEAPGAEEVVKKAPEGHTGVPHVGRSGKKLRQFIKHYITPNRLKWFMTNICLCRPNNNATPTYEMQQACKPKLEKIIEYTQPKVIVLLGATALYAFGYNEYKISKINGTLLDFTFKGRKIKVLPLLHPSAIIRNAFPETFYHSGFKTLINYLKPTSPDKMETNKDKQPLQDKSIQENSTTPKTQNTQNNPDIKNSMNILKFHDELVNDYYLVDIFNHYNVPYYILKHRLTGKKKIIKYPEYNNYYFWTSGKSDITIDANDGHLHIVNYQKYKRGEYNNISTTNTTYYESDVMLELKHTLEYFRQAKDHTKFSPDVLFIDIEVYRKGYKGFPSPAEAKFPINAITNYINGKYTTLLLRSENHANLTDAELVNLVWNTDENTEPQIKEIINKVKDNTEILIFNDEKQLLQYFIKYLNETFPDVITAWNISFDLGYIYNRMKKLNIDARRLSPLNSVNIEPEKNYISIDGYIIIDMLTLYKGFTFGAKESYKLSFIAKEELQDDKIQYEENLDELYTDNFQKFTVYNIKDVEIIKSLNEKLKHIDLLNMLRIITKTTWQRALDVSFMIDNLYIDRFHNQNKICRNHDSSKVTRMEVPGAYVMNPTPGLYKYVIDLDFSSLYPNLKRTYNIGPDTLVGAIDETVALDYLYLPYEKFKSKHKQITILVDLFNGTDKKITATPDQFTNFLEDKILTVSGSIYYKHSIKKSLSYEIITELLKNRKHYKNLMKKAIEEKNQKDRETYYNYQYALKVIANSIYGALAFVQSRWYNPFMAKSITISGREAARFSALYCDQYIKKLLGKITDIDENKIINQFYSEYFNNDITTEYVIYMDTDSLFVNLEPLLNLKQEEQQIVNKILNDIVPNLQNYLNDYTLKQILVNKIHKVNKDNCYLDLKQEMIAKTAYFLNVKKRYAAFIINREGKTVSEKEIKGLDTQRSDYPSLTKQKLDELLSMILERDKLDLDEISKFIKNTRNEFIKKIKEGQTSLSKPTSFTKALKNYKTITQNVKSMLLWNILEYDHFLPGTKGYLFKIKGIDFTKAPADVIEKYNKNINRINELKLDAISIPQEEHKLPDYYIIDVDHMIKFCWDDRINLLLGDMLKMHELKKEGRLKATF